MSRKARKDSQAEVGNALVPASKPNEVLIPAAVGTDKTALVPTNPRVASIAFRLRWTADTVVKRVESALPAPVEQKLYLQVAGGYRIHPESLAGLLEVFRGSQELQPSDLESRSVGPNLISNRFDEIFEKVEFALTLLDKTGDTAEQHLSVRAAALLVQHYGEQSLDVVGEIFENIGSVAELLGIKHTTNERVIIGVAVKVLVEEVLVHRVGRPLPLTVEEMFHDIKKLRSL